MTEVDTNIPTEGEAVGAPRMNEDVEESSQEYTVENEDGTTTTVMRQTKKVTRTVKQTVIQTIPVERETRIQIIMGTDGNYYYQDETGALRPAAELGIPMDQLTSSFTTDSSSTSDHLIQSRVTYVTVDEFGNPVPVESINGQNPGNLSGVPVHTAVPMKYGGGDDDHPGAGWELADTKVEVTLVPLDEHGNPILSPGTTGVLLPTSPGGAFNYIPVDADGNPIDPNLIPSLPKGSVRYLPIDADGNIMNPSEGPSEGLPDGITSNDDDYGLGSRVGPPTSTPIKPHTDLDENYGLRDSIAPRLQDGILECNQGMLPRVTTPTFTTPLRTGNGTPNFNGSFSGPRGELNGSPAFNTSQDPSTRPNSSFPQRYAPLRDPGDYGGTTNGAGPISGYPIYVKHGIAPLAPAESWADMDTESMRGTPMPSNRTSLAISENDIPPHILNPNLSSPVTPIAEESARAETITPNSLNTQADDRSMGSLDGSGTMMAPSTGDDEDDMYRDPTLAEVIEYLKDDNAPKVQANACAYLQHLMFKNEDVKNECRKLGGIEHLLNCASSLDLLVRKNACKALKNISHRDRNAASSTDDNKRAIKDQTGIPQLAKTLRNAADPQEKALAAAVLWNLSACEDLKEDILNDSASLPNIIDGILLPRAQFDPKARESFRGVSGLVTPDDLKNSLGVLRNVSSAGGKDPAVVRSQLRNWAGVIDSLIKIINSAIQDSDLDMKQSQDDNETALQPINNKVVENCACTLRNLSYRTQEIRDGTEYDAEEKDKDKSKENILAGGSTGTLKKKKKTDETYSCTKTNPSGSDLLWHSDTIQVYLTLLDSSVNSTTLAAAGGALQNLCACTWKTSTEIRSIVRRKMGLPMLVDLLALQDERAVCAMTWALRNLIANDATNRELVGKYGPANLAALLPPTEEDKLNDPAVTSHSEDTIFAALSTLSEIVHKNKTAAQEFVNKKGLSRTVALTKTSGKYTERTLKMAALVLRRLWLIKSLQRTYKEKDFAQEDFNVKKLEVAKSPEDTAFNQRNDTLFRQNKPSQSDEATLKKGRKKKGGKEEIPLNAIQTSNGTSEPTGETSV